MYVSVTAGIETDRAERLLRQNGKEVQLTSLEFALLDYLASRPNKICTREDILDHVWGRRFKYDTGTIDVHLNALRRKAGWNSKRPIETIRGVGLIFRAEREVAHYTIDLQTFLAEWLHSHEPETQRAGLVVQMHLTPFVNEITIEPEVLKRMLDNILAALLPSTHPGVLRLNTKLTMQSFILSLDMNGTINELRIPIYGDF